MYLYLGIITKSPKTNISPRNRRDITYIGDEAEKGGGSGSPFISTASRGIYQGIQSWIPAGVKGTFCLDELTRGKISFLWEGFVGIQPAYINKIIWCCLEFSSAPWYGSTVLQVGTVQYYGMREKPCF